MSMQVQRKTLLAATIPDNVTALRKVYEQHFDTRVVTRLDDALAQLGEGVDLVLCNIHFDEGALYALLRAVKAAPAASGIPFVAIDASPGASSPAIRQSIDIACKMLGADEVIHMAHWRAELGDAEAIEKVRRLVMRYVGA